MLTVTGYTALKIKPAHFRDTSHLQTVAAAAGATDVPMATPPATGWPDCTCAAVIAATEAAASPMAGVPLYPFFVGDAACRRVQHYKTMRDVARACTHWNTFIDELIRTKPPHGPVPRQLHVLAQALELTWAAIDPTVAAATGTAFGGICETAPDRAAAITSWRAAATYLDAGDDRHLHTALGHPMLVRREGLVEHAATKMVNEQLDAGIAALRSKAPKCVDAYTRYIHHAMAWAKHATHATAGDARLRFHADAMHRAKTSTVPGDVTASVSKAVVGWSA
jgi:hypothetical protein